MTTKIVSNDEIKVILGITGTTQDAVIEIQNALATELLLGLLNIEQLTQHAVIDEEVRIDDARSFVVEDFPIDLSQTVTLKDSQKRVLTQDLTFELKNKSRRTVRVLDTATSEPTVLHFCWLFVSYTAGYTIQETLEVLDFATLVGKKIDVFVSGTLTTFTFVASSPSTNEIEASVSNNNTATNIATALSGVANAAVVTLPLGTRTENNTTTSAMITITPATIPQGLKHLVALFVGGAISVQSTQGADVETLKIDDKAVKFRSESDRTTADQLLNTWIPHFRKLSFSDV